MSEDYRELCCRWCNQPFYVCLSCYRGEAYCSEECAREGYRAAQSKARAKHQADEDGRQDHLDRMRALRELQNKPVTEKGIVKLAPGAKVCPPSEDETPSTDAVGSEAEETTDAAGTFVGETPSKARLDACARGGETDHDEGTNGGGEMRFARCAVCGVLLRLRRSARSPRPG